MAIVRILVDGYSLLHNWLELAPGKARHSASARDELIQRLKLYQDAIGTPITIFFDGGGAPSGTPAALSTLPGTSDPPGAAPRERSSSFQRARQPRLSFIFAVSGLLL